MFKELRKQIRLSEEAEVSASTGQEVDLDELNEDEDEVVDTEGKTLEEIVSLFEDEVLTMDAEDAERLMTEDEDEEDEDEEDEESLEESLRYLFEDDTDGEDDEDEESLEEDDSEEDEEASIDKELEEMISFLEGDDEEDEVAEKEEEAKEKLTEALNSLRTLRKAKRRNRR